MELLQHQRNYQIRLHKNDEVEDVHVFELLANPHFPFTPNKIYYVKVISDNYPSVLGKKGTCYKHLGKEIPTYCTKSDIKIISKEEWETYATAESIDKIEEGIECKNCLHNFNEIEHKEDFDCVSKNYICKKCYEQEPTTFETCTPE